MSRYTMDPLWDWFHRSGLLTDNGCLEVEPVPQPTLDNPIHPIFDLSRWVKGHAQPTSKIYSRMKPSLQLASLMLTEPCMLAWFHHLEGGQYVKGLDDKGKPRSYILPHKYEHSRSCRKLVENNLEKLAGVVAFMFAPREYAMRNLPDGKMGPGAWGTTWSHTKMMPWAHFFRPQDYPAIDPKLKKGKFGNKPTPTISIREDYAEYFYVDYDKKGYCHRYRVWFLFATLLVHEVAHAYYMWYHRYSSSPQGGPEPFWNKTDKIAELGFSWESVTLGRIINPYFQNTYVGNEQALGCIQTEEWDPSRPQDRVEMFFKILDPKAYKEMDLGPIIVPGDSMQARNGQFDAWRGTEWHVPDSGRPDRNYLSVAHGIPMWWIFQWFEKGFWKHQREAFKRGEKYRPPSLGPTFVLIYERSCTKGVVKLMYGTKKDVDPYLREVYDEGDEMHLYDDGYWSE